MLGITANKPFSIISDKAVKTIVHRVIIEDTFVV